MYSAKCIVHYQLHAGFVKQYGNMKKFEFSSKDATPAFLGEVFYNVYKDAVFLKENDNVDTILSRGYELRKMLKNVKPGELVAVNGMKLERKTPLLVKKTGPNIAVEPYEFTANRLTGLTAAYAMDNYLHFPMLQSTEALALGLTWDNSNEKKCKLFLSSVSGTEHFYKQFQYLPLVCALKKLQLNKITLEPVIKIARIKNQDGVRMARDLLKNLTNVRDLWSYFPGHSEKDFLKQLELMPTELKKVFLDTN